MAWGRLFFGLGATLMPATIIQPPPPHQNVPLLKFDAIAVTESSFRVAVPEPFDMPGM